MDCDGSIRLDAGPARELTPEAVAPWAGNGIAAVVYGPTGGKGAMIDSFIGPLGCRTPALGTGVERDDHVSVASDRV